MNTMPLLRVLPLALVLTLADGCRSVQEGPGQPGGPDRPRAPRVIEPEPTPIPRKSPDGEGSPLRHTSPDPAAPAAGPEGT